MGHINDLVFSVSIRATLLSMKCGPIIAGALWTATKVTAVMLLSTLSVLLLQELGIVPQDEYVAEIAAILGYVLIAELFIISMLPASWKYPPPRRGMNHAKIRSAVKVGNRVHYDKTTDPSRYSHVGGPTKLNKKIYPDSAFKFAKRGQTGPDVLWKGGQHPSTYPGSGWPSGINKADFKPDTPTGKAMKLPSDTFRILYDPKTGEIKL